MPDPTYQRLTRARARSAFAIAFMSRTSLWLGPDHLLCVDFNGYVETYKRFYFRDIQVITIQKTKRRFAWNFILGGLASLCLAQFIGAMMGTHSIGNYIFIAIAGIILGIPLLANNLLGVTCISQLRTAVQIEELPSLCRLRQTRKVLAKIRPLILAAQNSVPDSGFPVQSSEPPPVLNPESPSKI